MTKVGNWIMDACADNDGYYRLLKAALAMCYQAPDFMEYMYIADVEVLPA